MLSSTSADGGPDTPFPGLGAASAQQQQQLQTPASATSSTAAVLPTPQAATAVKVSSSSPAKVAGGGGEAKTVTQPVRPQQGSRRPPRPPQAFNLDAALQELTLEGHGGANEAEERSASSSWTSQYQQQQLERPR